MADALERHGTATAGALVGCSPAEIAEVQEQCGFSLPLTYREFLAAMGRGAGRMFIGSHFFYPAIRLRDEAVTLMKERGLELPTDAFVFAMHQGYEFLFFRCTEGDDPPVYYYLEGSETYQRKHETFSAFLIRAACDPW